ncbi:MAG: hypothetical protein LH491_01330, partial [Pseudoxanthomonas sp.]|nr:hypothetical protein [Pseudoxanthomonas sp.]
RSPGAIHQLAFISAYQIGSTLAAQHPGAPDLAYDYRHDHVDCWAELGAVRVILPITSPHPDQDAGSPQT